MKKILYLFLLSLSAHFCFAQYGGSLDPSFATGGKLILSINPSSDVAYSMAALADGSFLVAGSTDNAVTGADFFCIKVNANGALVNSFGTAGKMTTDVQTGSTDVALSIAVDVPTGKFILAGYSDNGTKQYAALMRFNANGSIDSTFGTNGRVLSDWSGRTSTKEGIRSVKIHALTGNIVVCGNSATTSIYSTGIVARYLPSGQLDTSFAHTGVNFVVPSFSTGFQDVLRDLWVSSNGTITAVGDYDYAQSGNSYIGMIVRVTAAGVMDRSFNNTGSLESVWSNHLTKVSVESSGEIVAAGHADNQLGTGIGMTIQRYSSAGSYITWSNNNGYVPNPPGLDCIALSMARFANGDYVMGGTIQGRTTLGGTMMKLHSNTGYLDSAFSYPGTNGRAQFDFGSTSTELIDMVIQPADQKIVAVGYKDNDMYIARFYGNAVVTLDSFHYIAPANNAMDLIPTDIDLRWTKSPTAVSYEVQYDVSPGFGSTPQTITTTDTVFSNLTNALNLAIDQPYYWRIRASDGVNMGVYHSAWTFHTIPDHLSIVSPATHATGVALSPTLDWSDMVPPVRASVTGYELQFDSVSSFASAGNIYPMTASTYDITSVLGKAHPYYWRVRTVRDALRGTWTATADFVTMAPAGIDVLSADQDASISIGPNPAGNLLTIRSTTVRIMSAEAYDMLGRKTPINLTGGQADISSLPAGSYTLRISTDLGSTTRSFVKKD